MPQTDLIAGIRKGDRDAFDDLCREELPALMAYARAILPDEWADDAVQDVLYSFWKNRGGLESGTSVRGYLMRSVYNRSMNYLRKESLQRQYREWNDVRIALLGMEGADPERNPVLRNLFQGDLRKNLEDAIASLPPKCREVFMLSYVEGLPNKEIGSRLGISLSTVENHIYTALRHLRTVLAKDKMLAILTLLPYFGMLFQK